MSNDKVVSEHYLHGDLLKAIQEAVSKLGKTIDSLTIEDLVPVDEFHIGGRLATEHFMDQLDFSEQDHVLDVGCGLGGASRYVANRYNSRVTGIDLAEEYIETGNALCAWVKLDKHISLHQGSALSMPFQDNIFDGAYMMHVGMNIDDKVQLFKEIYRVLRPGASFGIYDVMRSMDGELTYPVPWASAESTSYLAAPDQYRYALENAGFMVFRENNRRQFAVDFFKRLREKPEARGGPPPLGLHILMGESTTIKINNLIENIAAEYIAPVEIIAQRGSD